MNRSQDIRLKEVVVSYEEFPYRTPLKFGGRISNKTTLINVEVVAETRDRKKATGFGSMPVGQVWAWPSETVTPEAAGKAMCDFAERIGRLVDGLDDYDHPIDTMFNVAAEYDHLGKIVSRDHKLPEPIPELAQLVAASAVDAAIHDAYGKANLLSSYNMLSREFMHHDLGYYLDDQFAGEYLDQYTLREPQPTMPLYHLVGAIDPLTPDEVTQRLNDGLPQTLGEWITADGLTHLKIKLNGEDLNWDVERVVAVERVATEAQNSRGCNQWAYSVDFNEKCQDVNYVLEFLRKVQELSPSAYDRIQYIEQPTHRNLKAHPENRMHEAAKLKPVVIDESLVSYEALQLARDLGYSGVALKACKGHTEALFAAAAAQKFGMFLCVQDLTCPGYSFLHSASLAARIPRVAAIEGNGRQYCPAANKRWAREFPRMFDIKNGTVGTGTLNGMGLGF